MTRTSYFLGVSILLATSRGTYSATPLSVQVSNVSISPNNSGHIDVLVSGSGEPLNLAGYEFRITPQAVTTSQLRFAEEDELFLPAANYLFAGKSAALGDGLASSVGTVSTTTLPDDTFIGGDGTSDLSNVVAGPSALLVRLRFEHDVGPADPATTIGHSFLIGLVPLTGNSLDFSGGNSNTGFVDSQFAPVAYQSTGGTVTIFVPEPTGFLLACIALVPLIVVRLR